MALLDFGTSKDQVKAVWFGDGGRTGFQPRGLTGSVQNNSHRMQRATQCAAPIVIPFLSSNATTIDPNSIVITPKASALQHSHQILSLSCKPGWLNPLKTRYEIG